MDFEDLDRIFTWQEARTLSASLTLAYREFDMLTHAHQAEVVPNKRLGAMLKIVSNFRDEKRSLKGPTRRYPAPARIS